MSNTITLGRSVPMGRRPLLPSNILATSMFVLTEVMFFTALVSAYLVIKAGSGVWAPPGDAVLPVAATAVNTGILLLSGVMLFVAGRSMRDVRKQDRAKLHYIQAVGLGVIFVSLQGYEWVQLLSHGMDVKANVFSSCFYLLIGSHALHAFAAILAMAWFYFTRMRHGKMTISQMTSMQIFWFFVVGIWPVLYGLVYF